MANAVLALALTLFAIGEDGAPLIPVPEAAASDAGEITDESPPIPAYTVWDALARCESSSRWFLNSGNSYYGGLQMDMTFWRRHGGTAYAPRADLASREAQIAVAVRGQSVQGWGAWPACSRQLGLR